MRSDAAPAAGSASLARTMRRHWQDARAVFAQPGRATPAGLAAQVRDARAAMDRWQALDERALLAQGAACRAALTRSTHLGARDAAAHRAQALGLVALAASRYLGITPTDAQLFGALAMHEGHAVDLAAGSGSTLAVACCAILHAWSGLPCHVVVADERQAARDAHAMGRLFAMSDCSVGWLGADTPRARLPQLYACDVLYASGRQLMTDHVRDRAALGDASSPLRRQLWRMTHGAASHAPLAPAMRAAVVDDIDRVLLDEALSPLVISASGNDAILEDASSAAAALAAELAPGRDYTVEFLPMADILFTEEGAARLATLALRLPAFWRSPARREEIVANAIVARDVLQQDKHYALREGRILPLGDQLQSLLGTRGWYAGVLQALEARAGVALTPPPRTLARTALQEFFPLYRTLGGTGAMLAGLAPELWRFYRLRTLAAPGQPEQGRVGWQRHVCATRKDKVGALIAQAAGLQARNLAVLVCAADAADLEAVAVALAEARLTARAALGFDPEQDARQLAQAGQPGALTLVTAAALRGATIPVSDPVRAAGGLQVLLSGHLDLRRLDMLVAARAGTPGQAHATQVFVSPEDPMFSRNLPFWAAPLHWLAHWPPARAGLTAWLVRTAQARTQRQLARHRLLLLKREQQLDQQLAFSRRA